MKTTKSVKPTPSTHFKYNYPALLRIELIGILPKQGSIDEIRCLRSLRALFTIREDEAKAMSLRITAGNVANWNTHADPQPEFQLTKEQATVLHASIRLASDEKRIPSRDEWIDFFDALDQWVQK